MTTLPSEPVPGATDAVVRSFLIADVRGYTRFTRERGDPAAALLAKKFADLARDAVEARGGRVIELRGDEALAVFDAPAQAIHAAIEFQATCAEESQADPMFPLPVGIGIDVGEAIPVEDGYRGVALNMAARLCSNAGAGQVLVTRNVREFARSLDGTVRFLDRGPASFKGFDQAVDVIEAVGDGASVLPDTAVGDAGLPPELDSLTPLVDRGHELRWRRGTWRQIRRGRGRGLVVSGPAQIGKTRLAAEIAAHVHREGGTVRYAGPGGAAAALAVAALREALGATAPTLLVLDDADVAGPAVAEAASESLTDLARTPLLVLALVRDPAATIELSALVEALDERGDGHRILGSLDMEGVRGIVRLYVGDDAAEVPLEAMVRASGGIPGRVHEVVGDWARSEASRRLEAAAEFLAKGRERHARDLKFANNVIGLKLGRLYTVQGRDVARLETCPYKGLAPFDEHDSAFFFGRERLVGELAARTVQASLLGVVGSSGSGKSSVVAAGLLPSLRAGLLPGSEHWTQATMRPGEHPLKELQEALGVRESAGDPLADSVANVPDQGRLVLTIDQFEETFTTCATDEERGAFIDSLARATEGSPDRIAVVLAIRGDYYAHCAPYPALAASLAANHVLVGPLSRDELRRAIELPARRAGLRLESALVEALTEEVADEPGGLPLLSTALVELWHARENGWIRMDAYERTGGVRGAVARLAETSYEQLSDPQKETARRIFLRLVAAGEGEGPARRRVQLDEFDLDRDSTASGVLTHLTRDRLLTMGEDTVEVAHEALLREWPRLQGWLDDDAQGRQLRVHLAQASRQWNSSDHEPSELYRGARLSATLDWSVAHAEELNQTEREFLAASRQASEHEAERQRRSNRRLRALLVGTAMFLVVALVAGALALAQRGSARQSARNAEGSAIVAQAQRLDAQSLIEGSPDLSVLLARQALELNDDQQTQSALFTTLLRWTGIVRVIRPNGNRLLRVAVSPKGDWLALSDNNDALFVDDARTYEARYVIHHFVDDMVSSNDGRRLFVAWAAKTTFGHAAGPEVVEAYDISTGKSVWRSSIGDGSESGLAISSDGRLLAMGDNPVIDTTTGPQPSGKPGTLTLLRASDGARLGPPLDLEKFRGVSFLGSNSIATSRGRTIEILNPRTGRVARTIGGATPTYAISPDGSTLAIGLGTGDVQLMDLVSGRRRLLRAPSTFSMLGLGFSPDGRTLAAGGENGIVMTWDVASGTARSLQGQTGNVIGVAFSGDGHTLYSDGLDGTAVVWDLLGNRSIQRSFRAPYPATPNTTLPYVAFTPDGRAIAVTGSDHRTHLLDAATLQEIGSLPKSSFECCMPPAFASHGDRMATVSGMGVDVWSASDRTLLRHLYTSSHKPGPAGPPVDADAMSPDGRTVAANDDNDVVLLDARTGTVEQRLNAGWYVAAIAFSSRGDLIAAEGGPPGGAQYSTVWDARTGRQLWRRKIAAQSSLASFSADGRLYAVGTNDGRVEVFNARSGRPVGRPFISDAGYTFSVTFDPGLPLVATTGTDAVVTLNDPVTGRVFGSPLAGGAESWATGSWSPDGSEYVLVGNDGVGHLWHISLRDWEARACRTAGRTLTRTEWRQFLPGRPYDPAC